MGVTQDELGTLLQKPLLRVLCLLLLHAICPVAVLIRCVQSFPWLLLHMSLMHFLSLVAP